MNIINDTLYLIGGYSYEKQCSSFVYTLSLNTVSSIWSDMSPKGGLFQGEFPLFQAQYPYFHDKA